MGRKATRWANLPPGMRARPRGAKVFYYLDTGGKPRVEIPLGSDYVAAVKKWADLTAEQKPKGVGYTFADLAREYKLRVIPGKSVGTQDANLRELDNLLRFFGDPPAPLDSIEPVHVRQFMDWRAKDAREAALAKGRKVPASYGQTRTNREKALLSHMWNYARAQGMTSRENPCAGIKRFKETARDVVVGDDPWQRVLAQADKPLALLLRLAALTGQRPGDVRRMSEEDLRDGVLHVRQGKVAAKLRIEVTGDLKILLDEIAEFKQQTQSRTSLLLVNERGVPLSYETFRSRFDKARAAAGVQKGEFQLRDLRATAATLVDEEHGIRAAQSLLGHTTEQTTAIYVRHKVGKKVAPVR